MADIKGLIDSLKKTLQQTGADFGSALKQLEALKREREDIAAAPTHRSDILAMMSARVDEDIARYWSAVDAGFHRLAGIGPERAAQSLGPEGSPPPGHPRFLAGLTKVDRDGQLEAVERRGVASGSALLAWIGGDVVKTRLAERLKSLEIPGEGLPAAERARKLATLDAKIERLEADLDEMRRTAESAGLRIIPADRPAPAPPLPSPVQRRELPVQTFPGSKPAGLDIHVTYGGESHD